MRELRQRCARCSRRIYRREHSVRETEAIKVLITGGCGFLGSNLAVDALANGDEVTLFDNLSRVGGTENLQWLREQGAIDFRHGDIRCRTDIEQTIKSAEPEAVIHLAGQVTMTRSLQNPRHDFEVNALGSLTLLEAVRQFAPDAQVLFSSTNKVYGDLEQFTYREDDTRYTCVEKPNGFAEDTPLGFKSPYGCSKGCADQYMLDYWRMYGIKTVVFRHSSMYGGRQFATYDQGWIGWFVQKCLEQVGRDKSQPFTISGNGKQVRDVLHADDMKALYREALANPDRCAGEVYNIGGGPENSLSILELLEMLGQFLEITPVFTKIDPRSSDQKVFVADLTKAKDSLAWSPVISAEDGVSKMISWTSDILGSCAAYRGLS